MNKAEIKQIILEEIENAINNMASNLDNRELVDPLATILSIPDTEDNEIEGPGIEDLSPDPMFGSDPSYVEEMARPKETWVATPKLEALLQHFIGKGGVDGLTAAMERISNVLTKTQNVGFKSRAKKYQKRFFTDEAGNVDKAKLRQFAELLFNPAGFTQSDIQNFVGFKNSAQANAFKIKLYKAKLINVQQSQDDSEDVSESKKKLEFDFSQVETPEKLPIDVDEQDLMDNIKKELKSSAEDYSGDGNKETANQLKDAVNWVDKNSLKGKVTLEEVYNFLTEFHKQLPDDDKMFLHEPTILELIEDEFKPYVDTEKEYQEIVSSVKQYLSSKQPQTMSELEKYIKKVIKEAKNPLAKKMKEIENQGRVAALETKLAAIAEMIEETNARLTRIDEDEEFTEMMDKNAVKEVRKQLKELERAQAKLQKEYDKVSEGKKRKTVVDEEEKSFDEKTPEEMSPEDTKNLALSQAGIPEEVSFELSEDASTNLELKSLAKKVYSSIKSQGYKVELNAGNRKSIKSSDFNKYSEKDKWAVVFFGEEAGGKRPGIDVLWRDPANMALPGEAEKAPKIYNDFISKLRQSVPELKDTKITKNGGMGIEGSEGIGIYPERGSNLSESMLRMQKLAGLIKS